MRGTSAAARQPLPNRCGIPNVHHKHGQLVALEGSAGDDDLAGVVAPLQVQVESPVKDTLAGQRIEMLLAAIDREQALYVRTASGANRTWAVMALSGRAEAQDRCSGQD